MNLLILQQSDVRDTCAAHLAIVFSYIRRHRQYKHMWSCVSQDCGKFLCGNLQVFYKALLLASEFPTLCERFFHGVFQFFIIWFNEEDTTWCSGIIELWFLESPLSLCFSLHQTYASTNPEIHCRVLRLFVSSSSLLPDHVCPSGGLSFNKVNLVQPVHASDDSLSPLHSSDHQYVFQQNVQWCMSGSGTVHVLQRNRKWFFFRHVLFDSGFHMMAITEISCKRPEIIFSIRIIQCGVIHRWVAEESPSDSPRKTWCYSPRSGRSLIKVDVLRTWSPPESLTVPSTTGNFKIVTSHRR